MAVAGIAGSVSATRRWRARCPSSGGAPMRRAMYYGSVPAVARRAAIFFGPVFPSIGTALAGIGDRDPDRG